MGINILCEQIDACEQRSCSFSGLLREPASDNYKTKRPFRICEKTTPQCQWRGSHASPVIIKAAHSVTFLETDLLTAPAYLESTVNVSRTALSGSCDKYWCPCAGQILVSCYTAGCCGMLQIFSGKEMVGRTCMKDAIGDSQLWGNYKKRLNGML